MVLLTVTSAGKEAIDTFVEVGTGDSVLDEDIAKLHARLSQAKSPIGSPIEHSELISISRHLIQRRGESARQWRLDALLKGSTVYQPPPPPKPEPTPEYKALMQRLRVQEEQRQYERMINPPAPEIFGERFPNATTSFGHAASSSADEIDEVTYADVNRQMVLIINVLVSIICTSVAVWMAARRWSVPQRLGLAFSSSTLVAVAEVAIYMGYIRRIEESKTKERKLVEKKEIVDTWVIDAKATGQESNPSDSARYRKGKHR